MRLAVYFLKRPFFRFRPLFKTGVARCRKQAEMNVAIEFQDFSNGVMAPRRGHDSRGKICRAYES